MIRVRVGRTGYIPIEFSKFPDGTSSFRFPIEKVGGSEENAPITVEWKYDGDHECILLWYLVKHIQYLYDQPIRLYLPYIPNARMDRVKSPDEVFTLKWFSQFVNALGFSEVVVCDPHSDVSTALIDNVIVRQQAHADVEVLTRRLSEENLLFCYPDEGAAKRYSGVFQREYVFCIKHRDWRTGKIQRLELTEPDAVDSKVYPGKQAWINLPPRLRMATLYAVAQSLSNGGRVANTCNLSEDFVGYSTKFGDSAGDFSPLGKLTVTQVRQIGHMLPIPAHLVDKTPSDGLCGKTDEDNLGFTYEQLDRHIAQGSCGDRAVDCKIMQMHVKNLHKLLPMPAFDPDKV